MSSNQQPGTLARRAYAGFLWQLLGFSLNTVLSVAHIVIMARLLSPEIFGQFAIASIIIALTMIVSEFGLGPALVQKSHVSDEDITFVFVFNVLFGILLFLFLYGFSDAISTLFKDAIDGEIIQALAIGLLVLPLGLASKSMLMRRMEFRQIFIATNLSYFVGMLLVGIWMANKGYGIWSLIIGYIVTGLTASVYFLFVSRISFSFSLNHDDAKSLFRYGLGLTAIQGVNQLALMSDKIILSLISSNTFLGLFERSQRIQQMPGVFIGGVVDTVLFSTLSKFSDNKPLLGQHFFNFVTLCVLAGGYLSILLFTFSEWVVAIVLGEQWLGAVAILKILSALICFQLLSRMSDTYIRATGEFKKSLKVKILYLVLVVTLALLGFAVGGVNGALIGIVLASGLNAAMMIRVCQTNCDYSNAELWERIRPGIVLCTLLLTKNLMLLKLAFKNPLVVFVTVLLTDLLLISLIFRSRYLLGKDNKKFIDSRLLEVLTLAKSKLRKA